jgi:periplasmic divalent cation tolerance protein
MKAGRAAMGFIVVFVTCKSAKEAQRIAARLIQKRLAACVNIAGRVKSIYRWKGKIEAANEILMVIKSTRKKFAALEKEIRRLHSYETPEIIALPIVAGSGAYVRWLSDSVKD